MDKAVIDINELGAENIQIVYNALIYGNIMNNIMYVHIGGNHIVMNIDIHDNITATVTCLHKWQ